MLDSRAVITTPRTLSIRLALLGTMAFLVASCSTHPGRPTGSGPSTPTPAPSGKYYLDDGPLSPPANVDLDAIPDAVPKPEMLHRAANRPYTVLGRDYVPATSLKRYKERGIASWYGRKFHGQKTSIGEPYDMFAMTAAHPTLPLPSYARVTNTATGKSVVVRVNDRGPFLHDRLIDLSYAAAWKLGIAQNGSGEVEVEAIVPGENVVAMATPPLPPVDGTAATPAPAMVTAASAPAVATTAAAPAAPTVPLEPAIQYSVQLGAFSNYANAQAFLAHVTTELASAQVEPKVRQAGGLFRVYVGPYPDRDEARRVGERISQAFGFATTLSAH
ncbi:MAG TPA: septal ring lytic transglycosylase RlpA family protein [Casimicrobiaceae bacterium]|nr:septal ring lytic transglycosylase RlpA family protein [Casimicrobiaceae bacterium]